jgi:hypothetical protein
MPEFNETNVDGQGGRDKDKKDKVGDFFLGIAAAAAAAAVVAIGKELFGERSVIITVSNQTSGSLAKIDDVHESGGFAQLPALAIPSSSTDTFGSHNTDPLQGAIGSVTYAGDGFTLLVDWSNPRFGANSTNHVLDGKNKSRFLVTRQTGRGNEKAEMLFALSVHPDYSVRKSLEQKGDVGRGLRAFGVAGSIISVRDLVNF